MLESYPDWLKRNCSGLDFGKQPQLVQETERFALVKVPGHWARLGAYGQSYVAVAYMIVAKHRVGQFSGLTDWYRTILYGRPSSGQRVILEDWLREAERSNQLPDRAVEPRLHITNRR